MKKSEPSFRAELWIEKPDAAEALMNSDSVNASDYTAAGLAVAGTIFMAWVVNKVVKSSAGPFGGLIDMAIKTFKPDNNEKNRDS